MADKPRKFSYGDVHGRPFRPPRPHDPERWYWRARKYTEAGEESVWTGWGTRAEAMAATEETIKRGGRKASTGCDTVTDLLDFWLGEQERRGETGELKPRSVKTFRAVCKALQSTIGSVQIERVTSRTLEDHKDRRLRGGGRGKGRTGAPCSTSAVEREVRTLIQAWRWGFEQGLHAMATPAKPLVKVRPSRETHTPTEAEVLRVLACLSGWPALLVRLYYATGARLGEITALTWGDVDLASATVTVDGKTGRRRVPLGASAVGLLRETRGDAEASSRLLPVTKSSADTSLRRYLKAAIEQANADKAFPAIPYWTAQGLRRFAVDRLYRSGARPEVAGKVVGHTPAVAWKHYRRVQEEEIRAAAEMAGLGELPDTVVDIRGGRRA